MDRGRIEEAVRAILESLGEDTCREGLVRTPTRVADMFLEVLDGYGKDPKAALASVFYDESYQGAVVVRDIDFFSMCEHHLLPFFGRAHIGYIPSGKIAGASKLARALGVVAHRLQLQERITEELAQALMDALEPDGVVVVLEAEHLCMAMRGIKRPGSTVVTTAVRGGFARGSIGRDELLDMVRTAG